MSPTELELIQAEEKLSTLDPGSIEYADLQDEVRWLRHWVQCEQDRPAWALYQS